MCGYRKNSYQPKSEYRFQGRVVGLPNKKWRGAIRLLFLFFYKNFHGKRWTVILVYQRIFE
jgi:hypothetical protein